MYAVKYTRIKFTSGRSYKMVTIACGEWIADLGNMTCWNINTKIVVEMQKSGKTYIGEIKNFPIELMGDGQSWGMGRGVSVKR
jgi:hypothetical protein